MPASAPLDQGDESSSRHEVRLGLAAGLSAYVLWGLLTIYWKALGDLDARELIGWRILFSLVVLVAVLAARGRLGSLRHTLGSSAPWRWVTVAALLLAVNWTTYVHAVVTDRVIETALGYFMAPIGTMLIGMFVLREDRRSAHWVILGLAAAAVAVLTLSYGQVPVLALLLAITWSVYGLLKKRTPLGPLDGLTAETLVLAPPAVAVLFWGSSRVGGVVDVADARLWVLLGLSGVVTTVPLVLFAASAHRVPLTVLGPLQYSVPTINLVLGWVVFREDMPATRLAGFCLVWAGLIVLTVDSLRRARRTRASMHVDPVPA